MIMYVSTIGSVSLRNANNCYQQSPPPEPTPEPPPQPAPAPKQVNRTTSQDPPSHSAHSGMGYPLSSLARPPVAITASQPSMTATSLQTGSSQSASPGPKQIQQQPLQAALNYSTATPALSQTPSYSQYGSSKYPQQSSSQHTASVQPLPNGQRMPDVFYLQAANNAIPEDIRNEFQRDEQGRVLFFTKPPISVQRPENDEPPVQLSTKARAAIIRRRLENEKAKEIVLVDRTKERPSKRRKQMNEEPSHPHHLATALDDWRNWLKQYQRGTNEIWKLNYGEDWQKVGRVEMEALKARQLVAKAQREVLEAKAPSEKKFNEETRKMFKGPAVYKDDVNPRY